MEQHQRHVLDLFQRADADGAFCLARGVALALVRSLLPCASARELAKVGEVMECATDDAIRYVGRVPTGFRAVEFAHGGGA